MEHAWKRLRRSRLWHVVGLLMFAQLGFPSYAQAQLTIGLEGRTNSMIEGLPPKIKDELIKFLKEALPLIDKSVDKYLTRVDEILHKNIEDGLASAQCSVIGVGAQFAD